MAFPVQTVVGENTNNGGGDFFTTEAQEVIHGGAEGYQYSNLAGMSS
jgi:hypothetical protein